MLDKAIALIGAGEWGKNHLRQLKSLGVLHSVVDSSTQIVSQRGEEFPGITIHGDVTAILENRDIRAAVICAPASQHYDLTKKCLKAGKDVLVEKPLALTHQQGLELVRLAAERKRVLMVGHILQYHPAVIRLKEFVAGGELGKVRYIYSNRLNMGKLRVEENVLWSFAPHDISLILMLLNQEMPSSIEAFGGSFVRPGVFDTTLTFLEFSSGVKAHIFVSWLHPFKEQKLVVVGSEGMAVFDDLAHDKLLVYHHAIDITPGQIPVARKAESYPVSHENLEPLRQELIHFMECIEKRLVPRTDGQEGLRVLRVLEQAQSALEGKKHG